MNVIVDFDLCQNHGQCAFAAPNVFRIDDAGMLQFDEHPDESERQNVEDAIDVCPVQAIRLAD